MPGVWIPSPFGPFFLTASEKGLYSLSFPGNKERLVLKKFLVSLSTPPYLRRAKDLLGRYFKGHAVSWKSLAIDFPKGSTFQSKVLHALQRVPYGKTITYGDLARSAGFPKAARAVGSVLKKNRLPLILPCHRVVRAGGTLGEYAWGVAWKKRLLALEEIGIRGPSVSISAGRTVFGERRGSDIIPDSCDRRGEKNGSDMPAKKSI